VPPLRSVAVALVIVQFVAMHAHAQRPDSAPPRPQVTARLMHGTIELDGHLDDPAWADADSIPGLLQREPREGEPGSERTVVKVLRDATSLWVGIRAYDRDPKAIVATQYRRDADLDVDDNVAFTIDSYDEQRTAFVFATNPNAMMFDAQISGVDNENISWNGIWYVAASRDSLGWSAEFRIPFRTLRFHDGTGVPFGFNVRRFIRRRDEEDLWQSWLRTQGIQNLQFEGEVVIAGPLVRGFDGELRPNALVRYRLPEHDSTGAQTAPVNVAGKVGMDAKFALAPTLTADVTVNADFSEVESDEQVLNLTRFPLFFPEKREFFIESSNIFTFGADLRNQLFYSRRIGLTDSGAPVPILAGVRSYGNVGPWTLGALALRTGNPDDAFDAVVRLERNVLARSYIGAIATVRTGPGVMGTQTAAGIDLDFPLTVQGQNLEPKFWIAGTRTPGVPGTPTAWRAYIDYPNDIWDNFISLYRVERGFDPTLGFVIRDSILETTAHFDWMPRPSSGPIRNYDFQLISWDIITSDTGTLARTSEWETAEFDVRPFGLQFQSGDRIGFDIIRDFDAPADTFFIFPGSVVPPGRYWWTRGLVTATFAPGRVVSGSLSLGSGGFYDGRASTITASAIWRGGGRFQFGADGALSDVHLPGGNFTAFQAALRLEYDVGTRLSILGFIQHSNETQRADFQLRLHWIPVIGDNVYVVWNSGYTTYRLAPWRFPAWDALPHQLNGALVFKAEHRIPL
jgi:hypothetical protein